LVHGVLGINIADGISSAAPIGTSHTGNCKWIGAVEFEVRIRQSEVEAARAWRAGDPLFPKSRADASNVIGAMQMWTLP
jgi:hypothetical protein